MSVIESSPVPKPEVVKGYHDINPAFAQSIFDNYDKQVEHRISMEAKSQRRAYVYKMTGLVLGFMALLIMIGAGTAIAIYVNKIVGMSLAGAGILVSLVKIFVGAELQPDRKPKKKTAK